LNNILHVQSKPVGKSGLYYYETSFDKFVFITKKEARDSSGSMGSLFIVSAPKHFQNESNLNPVLFKSEDPNNITNYNLYSYAIYDTTKLIVHSNNFEFKVKLDSAEIPNQEISRREVKDQDQLWYKPGNNKVVILGKTNESLIESITLFSYLFCAFILMVAILRFFSVLVRLSFDWRSDGFLSGLNIRTQIHGTIIL